ncbi:hypothetical protein [Moellerella wisconsensis]|uniref:hypothetical protein n=1 Tax=Moellerella wisconsensis TaxID=158849 RepID=UPI003076674A
MLNIIKIFMFSIFLLPITGVANQYTSDNSKLDIVSLTASSRLFPEEVVTKFYESYLKNTNEENLVESYVAPELALKLYHSSICNYDSDVDEKELEKICKKDQKCKQSSGNIICDWNGTWIETDVNYFIKSQGDALSWQQHINVFPISQDAYIAYIFTVLGDGSDINRYLLIELVKITKEWKINKVINKYNKEDK